MSRLLSLAFAVLAAMPASAGVSFTGTFYNAPNDPNGVVSADFDRDGLPDMAVASGNTISVYLATSPGKFGAEKDYIVSSTAFLGNLIAADLNADGALDLIVSKQNAAEISILWNNGDGTFRSGPNVKLGSPASFDIGDFDHDGILDIATVECTSVYPISCSLNSYKGKGNGVFSKVQTIKLSNLAGATQVADMDGDGIPDVVLTFATQILIFWGKGDATFSGPTHLNPNTSDDVESFAIADFTNDSKLDVVIDTGVNLSTFTGCVSGGAWFYKNLGARKFSLLWHSGGGCTFLNAIDMNGDLNEDLIEQNGDPDAGFFGGALGNGDGTFRTPQSPSFPNQVGGVVYVRDLNLDSRDDYIVGEAFSEIVVALQTGGSKSCKPPASAKLAAKICVPAAGATVSSPVLVQAAGNSPAGVAQLQIWIDGVKQAVKWHDEISKKFTLPPGTHRIAVAANDKYIGTAKTSITVKVP